MQDTIKFETAHPQTELAATRASSTFVQCLFFVALLNFIARNLFAFVYRDFALEIRKFPERSTRIALARNNLSVVLSRPLFVLFFVLAFPIDGLLLCTNLLSSVVSINARRNTEMKPVTSE